MHDAPPAADSDGPRVRRLFISADMEGVAGVASIDQLVPGRFEWETARG